MKFQTPSHTQKKPDKISKVEKVYNAMLKFRRKAERDKKEK